MRALVTGVTGFVGAHLARRLLAAGDVVRGTGRDAQWPVAPDAELAKCALTAWDLSIEGPAPEELSEFAPEVVYHLAAISVPEDCGGAEPTRAAWDLNVEGTARVLRWAAKLPRRPRVLVASSSHVYAPVAPPEVVVAEDAALGPVNAYGLTKLAAEELAWRAADAGLETIVVRSFAQTGPGQSPRLMLPEWCEQLARGGEGALHVHTLDADVDLLDVRDGVEALRRLAEHGKSGLAYNLGSGIRRRSGDVLEALQRVAGTRRAVVELRPGAKHGPIAELSRLREATGWRPQIPWEVTLRDTLADWRRRVRDRRRRE